MNNGGSFQPKNVLYSPTISVLSSCHGLNFISSIDECGVIGVGEAEANLIPHPTVIPLENEVGSVIALIAARRTKIH